MESESNAANATIIQDDTSLRFERAIADSNALWLDATELKLLAGWGIKPQGICRGDLCVPIPPGRENEFVSKRDGAAWLNFTALANQMGKPWAGDSKHRVWYFGAEVPYAMLGVAGPRLAHLVGQRGEVEPRRAITLRYEFVLAARRNRHAQIAAADSLGFDLPSGEQLKLCRVEPQRIRISDRAFETQRRIVLNDRGVGRVRFAFHSVFLPLSSFERRLQVLAFAFAESNCNAEALEVLIDYFTAEAHAMFTEEPFHFVFAIEQCNDRLAHPWQRVVGIFLNHLVPMRAREVPRLVAARGVEQQRVHKVRRILGPHLAVERHLHGFLQQVAVAEICEREQETLLFLRRARGFEFFPELLVARGVARMRKDIDQRRHQVAIGGVGIVLEARVQIARALLHLGIVAECAERADQHAAQLPRKLAL